MKRLAENYLENWIVSPHKKPLIIRGARQTGKSTLVRNFAANLGYELFEINLEKHVSLDNVFKSLDIDRIILELEGVLSKKISTENSILFLDEIQSTPHALAALRYFYEEKPELNLISAGSLLEFALKESNFSMPVGRVQYLYLGPMTFEEWLMAKGEDYLLKTCKEFNWDKDFSEGVSKGISNNAHDSLLKLLREYFITGGMPEVVSVYNKAKDFEATRELQKNITLSYQDDFSKYAVKKNLALLEQILFKGVQAVGEKVKFTNFSSDHSSKEVKDNLELLCLARVFEKVIHSDANGLPLNAESRQSVFKLLFLDIGLMLRYLGLDLNDLNNISNSKLVNEGKIAEQVIGQHLIYSSDFHNLCYWLREGKKGNAEIDFVLPFRGDIIGVEVKAGKSGSLKSLREFVALKNSKYALRFDLNPPSIQEIEFEHKIKGVKKFKLISLPIYLVGEWERILRLE